MAFNKLTIFVADKTKQIINFYNQKIEKVSSNPVYVGEVPINGEKIKIASTFGNGDVNDIAAELIANEGCQIAVIVNTDLNQVNFRKKSGCKVNLDNLARKLCNGEGSNKIAKGEITETFLNFTKLLSQK